MLIRHFDPRFDITGKVHEDKFSMVMRVNKKDHIFTTRLPATTNVLAAHLPSVFDCQCFNDANKDFEDESKNTELGHLFEHILLEYLCMEKLEKGHTEAVYEGVTNWNWQKEKFGTFNIEITAGLEDIEIIERAFRKSVNLLNKILVN